MGGHGRAPLGDTGSQPLPQWTRRALSPCGVWTAWPGGLWGWGRSAGAWCDGHVSGELERWLASGYQGEPQQHIARAPGSQGS